MLPARHADRDGAGAVGTTDALPPRRRRRSGAHAAKERGLRREPQDGPRSRHPLETLCPLRMQPV